MRKDLYRDPLTGFFNLFFLMEANLADLFGTRGTILFFDAEGLMRVNERFGREGGDNYLRVLARAISTAAEGIVDGSPSQPFRVGGDEFLLVLAGQVLADPDALANDIRTRLGASLATLGMSGGVHASAWVYESTPRSAAEVLKRLHHALRHDAGDETDGLLPRWADSMMDWMFRRIGETVRLLDDANAAALSDEISGQPNHRAAVMELEGWNEEVAAGAQHCLLFIDGDNLKRYNTLGYEVGNHMIRDLAGALRRTVRAEDGLYRWLSGDEFIVTLRNTDRPTAIRLAERIRSQVETTTRGWVFPITVSIGVACLPTDATTTTEALRVAERANRRAKEGGKNRIV